MHFTTFLAFTATAAFAAPAPAPGPTHKLHEKRDWLSDHWTRGREVHHEALLPVRIGMQQANMENAEALLMEVSDQDSPKYGQHYTAEEVADIFAPAEATVETIKAWLHESGIHPHRVSQSWNKQWMQFDASAQELGDLLKTKYHEYLHGPTGKTHVACDQYDIPPIYTDSCILILYQVLCSSPRCRARRLHHPWHQAHGACPQAR